MSMSANAYRIVSTEEHDIQVALLEYVALRGRKDMFVFAIPNAGRRSPRVGRRMKAEGLKAGIADLCFMLKDQRVAWMELKTETGRYSPAQKKFRAICDALNHVYLQPRSLDQAIKMLKNLGLVK